MSTHPPYECSYDVCSCHWHWYIQEETMNKPKCPECKSDVLVVRSNRINTIFNCVSCAHIFRVKNRDLKESTDEVS